MKVVRQIGEKLRFEFEADSPRLIVDRLALIDSLFVDEPCGCCGGLDIRFVKREVTKGAYLELQCQNENCRATLQFHQKKDEKNLYIKRWDSEASEPLPNRGWRIYKKEESSNGEAQRRESSKSNYDEVPF